MWWLAAATRVRESVRGALARQEGLSLTRLVLFGAMRFTPRFHSGPPYGVPFGLSLRVFYVDAV